MGARERFRLGAGHGAGLGEAEQRAHLIEGEAEVTTTQDETQALFMRGAIEAVAIGGARRRGQKTGFLIIADGFEMAAGALGEFAACQERRQGHHRRVISRHEKTS